jgi:hypothetical protein
MSHPLKTTVRPVIMLNGEFSTWTKIYDCTPPSGERECLAFWWSIHREPWKRVSAEIAAGREFREAQQPTDAAVVSAMAIAETAMAEDWE